MHVAVGQTVNTCSKQVEFDPKEPAHRSFPPRGEFAHDPVLVGPLGVTGPQGGGVDKVGAGAPGQRAAVEQKAHQQEQRRGDARHEVVVQGQGFEVRPEVFADVLDVVALEVFVGAHVVVDQDGRHFAAAQTKGAAPARLGGKGGEPPKRIVSGHLLVELVKFKVNFGKHRRGAMSNLLFAPQK